ncbi:hypothetical protein PM082_011409 [Marasmius tenuissimus]|nr:hypothetical protein PM082_011409 [Marasmius tenuissimus]
MGIASTFIIVRTALGVAMDHERLFKDSIPGSTAQVSHRLNFPERNTNPGSPGPGGENEEREEYSMRRYRVQDSESGSINGGGSLSDQNCPLKA